MAVTPQSPGDLAVERQPGTCDFFFRKKKVFLIFFTLLILDDFFFLIFTPDWNGKHGPGLALGFLPTLSLSGLVTHCLLARAGENCIALTMLNLDDEKKSCRIITECHNSWRSIPK